jgi:hypothetical protein
MENKIYKNLSYEDYANLEAVRSNWLSKIRECPAKLKYFLDHPEEDKIEAGPFGIAFHCLVLTPALFDQTVAVAPVLDRRTNAGRAEWSEFIEANASKVVLKQDEFELVQAMAYAIKDCESADKLLQNVETEVSLVWSDKETTETCKARLDAYSENLKTIIDLKSCRTANYYAMSSSCWDYGYVAQAAWYLEGARSCGLDVENYVLVCTEKEPPHCTRVWLLDPEDIALVAKQNTDLLKKIHACKVTGQWPGYPSLVEPLRLPQYAIETLKSQYGV